MKAIVQATLLAGLLGSDGALSQPTKSLGPAASPIRSAPSNAIRR